MADEISDAIIRVRDITVQFGKTRVLDGLNLDVKRGEILGFVGPSGAGKSVLTRTIIGLVPKIAGSIEVFGVDLDAASAAERRGVEPEAFLLRLRDAISIDHFVVGMIKAPVMAAVIGIVACVEGLSVQGSAESLGQHTTSSVVKGIFFVIVMDGVFAIFFASIGM